MPTSSGCAYSCTFTFPYPARIIQQNTCVKTHYGTNGNISTAGSRYNECHTDCQYGDFTSTVQDVDQTSVKYTILNGNHKEGKRCASCCNIIYYVDQHDQDHTENRKEQTFLRQFLKLPITAHLLRLLSLRSSGSYLPHQSLQPSDRHGELPYGCRYGAFPQSQRK